jgi:extracellular elastinolytic metalloproteinase
MIANNFGKGGAEGDAIVVRNLDLFRQNDATFSSPPDGQPGVLSVYLWTLRGGVRSGAFDNTLMSHEFFHGVTNRLTGGARDSRCLLTLNSRGMGEGWSDFFSILMTRNASHTREDDVSIGTYVFKLPQGVRSMPYSTNMARNGITYADFNLRTSVHRKGEVWAVALFEIYWNLVDKFGFSPDWLNAKQEKGNIMALDLIIQGVRLQPCDPTVLQARDAIVTAARADIKCDVWKGFAKRGLGPNATKDFQNDFSLPVECAGASTTTTTETSTTVIVTTTLSVPEMTTSVPVVAPSVVITTSSVPPTVPTSVPPTPTNPPTPSVTPTPPAPPAIPISVSFGRSGSPTVVQNPRRGVPSRITFDATRLNRICDNIRLCYYRMFRSATCTSVPSKRAPTEEFVVTFPESGSYMLYVETSSTGCSASDSNWNRLGYSVRVD